MPDLASKAHETHSGEGPTRFCPTCYARNRWESARCEGCGSLLVTPRDFDAALVWALDHPDTESAMLAARLLGERKTPSAIEPLGRLSRLRDDPYRAAAAVRALGEFADQPAADALIEAARSHPSVVVRRAAGAARSLAAPDESQAGTGVAATAPRS